MEDKKYELTDETIEINEHTLHRIRALKDFAEIKKGDLGGFIEKEDNLSQWGNSWVGDEAKVYEDAQVYGDAMVYGNSEVKDNARVYGDAWVYENAVVKGNAEIGGWGIVKGNAEISEGKVIIETVYGGKSVIWKPRKNPEID